MTAPAPALTSLSHGAGCGCKLSAADLRPIVAGLPAPTDPRVLVAADTADDAGVVKLTDELALVHTAEGQLFREAIVEASEAAGVPVTRFVQHELFEEAAEHVGTSDASLRAQLTGLGRALGPPWQRDQKEAAAAAWLALALAGRRDPAAHARPTS